MLVGLESFPRGQWCQFGARHASAYRSLPSCRPRRSQRLRDRLPYSNPTFFLPRARLVSCPDELVAEHRIVQDLQYGRCRGTGVVGGRERPSRPREREHGKRAGAIWGAAAHSPPPGAGGIPGTCHGHLSKHTELRRNSIHEPDHHARKPQSGGAVVRHLHRPDPGTDPDRGADGGRAPAARGQREPPVRYLARSERAAGRQWRF
jgi:hypothetical protein